MKKSMDSDKSISLILRIALSVIIVCVGATFLHVFDVENVFKKSALESYEGHVKTATYEIEYQVDIMKHMMDSYEANMQGVYLNEEINSIIAYQESYTQGYDFYYLASNGVW